MEVKAELHSHNQFSNFHLGNDETPYDCNITIREQLERANDLELQALFVTNHNTLDGYSNLLQYKNDHHKFKNIQIYPAEEISIDSGAHVLAYGIHQEIKSGLSIEKVIDEIKTQNGISSAPHPFSLIDALREKAKQCDMIEVFNSNNIDVISNVKATEFAMDNNKLKVAGSDSHVLSTIGRCVNVIESENNLDDVLHAMRHNKIKIHQTGYALQNEIMEHMKYKVNNSKNYIFEYVQDHFPNFVWAFKLLYKLYNLDQNSYLWSLFYKIAVYYIKRISNKINFQNIDGEFMTNRNLFTMFKMGLW